MPILLTSRGRVSLASAAVTNSPIFDPNYYVSTIDREALIYGIRRLMQALLDTKAEKGFIASEMWPPDMTPLNFKSKDEEIDVQL